MTSVMKQCYEQPLITIILLGPLTMKYLVGLFVLKIYLESDLEVDESNVLDEDTELLTD